MKRAGFTMIELIFVIVILGILAAVALPKFIGVSEQAHEAKLKAYVGTLNRTVAPALWSAAMGSDQGSIKTDAYSTSLVTQLNTPEFGDAGTVLDDPDLTACDDYAAPATPADGYTDAEIIAWGEVSTATVGAKVYNVRCIDGTLNSSPLFALTMKDGANAEVVLVK